MDAHRSAQPDDDVFHDVHPDAAPRDVGGGRARAEAGLEDELEQLRRAPALQIRGGRERAANRRGAQLLRIDAAAVVADGNEDAVSLLLRRDQELARGRLDLAKPLGRALDAVIDRVPHQVNQRIRDLLDDLLVELRLTAADRDLDFLVELPREIARGAREGVEHRVQRQHREADHVLPELLGDEVEAHPIVAELAAELPEAPAELLQRFGVLAEGGAGAVCGRGREARFTRAIAQPAERGVQTAQLDVPLRGLEALDDQLRREMRQAVQFFHRDAERLPHGPGRLRRRPGCRVRRRGRGRAVLRGTHRARRQAAERPAQRGDVRGRADPARELLHADRQRVDRAEDDVEGDGVEPPRVLLRGHEHFFEVVHDLRDVEEPEHARRALQVVALPQHLRHRILRARHFLEAQHRGRQPLQAIPCLLDELADECGRVECVHGVNPRLSRPQSAFQLVALGLTG